MVVKKFPKDKKGKVFRVEVAHVSPPVVTNPPPKVGEPIKLETNVLGVKAGATVEFKIFEPHRLHEAPLATVSGTTAEADRGVTAEWTFDWDANKDKVDGTRFVCVAKCGDFLNISDEPFQVVQPFTVEVKDPAGKPFKGAKVVLWSERGQNVEATTDDTGKVEALVPPGAYRVEVGEDLPPEGPAPAVVDPPLEPIPTDKLRQKTHQGS